MRTPAPPLLPLLRSQVQGDLLALLYLHPERSYSLTEAAGRIGVSVKAVQQEATRLVEAGFLADERRGPLRLIRARTDSPVARPLTDLLAVTYGPMPVLTDVLGGVDGIVHAFIYGSWAARYRGEPGPVPVDVDVLVVGTADVDDLHAAALAAEERLGRPVDIRRVRLPLWEAAEDPFLATVRDRPLVELDLRGGEQA
jgi:predicted nucleotidyltransferase